MTMQMLQEAQQRGIAAALAQIKNEETIYEAGREQCMPLDQAAQAAQTAHLIYQTQLAYLIQGNLNAGYSIPPSAHYHTSAAILTNWAADNGMERSVNGMERVVNGMERITNGMERSVNGIDQATVQTPPYTDTNTSTTNSAPNSPPDSPLGADASPGTAVITRTPKRSMKLSPLSPVFNKHLITPPTTQQRGKARRLSECSSENFDPPPKAKRQCKINVDSAIPTYVPPIEMSKIGVHLFTPTAKNGPMSPPSSGSSPGSAHGNERQRRGDGSSRDKNFKCKICLRCFGYKHVLQNHERTHTGEKPFECRECHKRFTRDHHLKTHMRLHTGEKPYHCDHCDRQFVQVANLRRHLRVHTGERPYKCDSCKCTFSDSNQLKAHLLTHTYEKPLECKRCHAKFRPREVMAAHKCDLPMRMGSRRPDKAPVIRRPSTDSPATVFSADIIGTTGNNFPLPSFAYRSSFQPEETLPNLNTTLQSSDDQNSRHSDATSGASTAIADDQPLDLSDDGSASGRVPRKAHEVQRTRRTPTPTRLFNDHDILPIQTEPEDLRLRRSPESSSSLPSSTSSPPSPTVSAMPTVPTSRVEAQAVEDYYFKENMAALTRPPRFEQFTTDADFINTNTRTSSKLKTIFENARESEYSKDSFARIDDAANVYDQQHHQKGEHSNLNAFFFAQQNHLLK